jgi:hypothetical protein
VRKKGAERRRRRRQAWCVSHKCIVSKSPCAWESGKDDDPVR